MKRTLRLLSEIKGGTGFIALIFSFIILSQDLWAQSKDVSGTVTSSDDNTAIPGANILIKGTTIGTTTDAEGKFTISVESNSTVLQISFIGYATQEIVVGTSL